MAEDKFNAFIDESGNLNVGFQTSDSRLVERVNTPPEVLGTSPVTYVDVLFDRLPDQDGCNFIDCVDENGQGINAGEWIKREDGTVALRIITLR